MKRIIKLGYSLFIESYVDGEIRTTNFKHKALQFDVSDRSDAILDRIKRAYSKMNCLNPEFVKYKS